MFRYTNTPHSVRLVLSRKCNLHCDYCLNDSSNLANDEELNTSEWLTFFERLKELHVFNVTLSGGEIFLRKDIFVLLKKLRENRMHQLSLLTNGTLITGEMAEQLSRLKIKFISISVDGLEEKHDKIRGKGAFKKTIKGIRNLIGAGIKPQLSFTPVKNNYIDLGPVIDFAVSLGLPIIRLNTLSPEGRCTKIYKEIALEFPDQVKDVLDVVEEKKKLYPGLQIDCQLGFHYRLPQSYEQYKKNPQNYKIKCLKEGCGAASTSCAVTASGNIIPCEGFPTFVGGNIRERDFLDIWENSKSLKTIRDLSKVSMDRTPYCKDCKYIYLCNGGCRASAYLIYNDLIAPGISCPYWEGAQAGKKPELEEIENVSIAEMERINAQ